MAISLLASPSPTNRTTSSSVGISDAQSLDGRLRPRDPLRPRALLTAVCGFNGVQVPADNTGDRHLIGLTLVLVTPRLFSARPRAVRELSASRMRSCFEREASRSRLAKMALAAGEPRVAVTATSSCGRCVAAEASENPLYLRTCPAHSRR